MANRSANTYQKINTIFKRDANNIIMPYDGLVDETLDYLRQYDIKFDASEKIDGTSTRIEVSRECVIDSALDFAPSGVRFNVSYKGKSDEAQMPKHLEAFLKENYPEDKVFAALGIKKFIPIAEFVDHKWGNVDGNGNFTPDVSKVPEMYTIYGEGYGMKIQKGGGNYIPDGVGFIVFDVKVNNIYLLRANRDEIAAKLGAPVVPYMGQFTIDEAIEFVRKGFKSTIAANKDYDAEGLVLTTPIGLKDRSGARIIFKVKTKDFRDYRKRYGTNDKVDQPENTKYKSA